MEFGPVVRVVCAGLCGVLLHGGHKLFPRFGGCGVNRCVPMVIAGSATMQLTLKKLTRPAIPQEGGSSGCLAPTTRNLPEK